MIMENQEMVMEKSWGGGGIANAHYCPFIGITLTSQEFKLKYST